MPSPSRDIIRQLFDDHIAEHATLPDSARLRDFGAEKALIQDYSGRVIYELLQNALDRAQRHILIWFEQSSGHLNVANDGDCVSVYRGLLDNRPSDFHALLSLHSSAKTASESIGNKGVGFRSIFSVTDEVEVWSRTAGGFWWALKLMHPCTAEPEPSAGTQWTANEVASFYAPELVLEPPDAADFAAFQTVVRLRVREERRDQVESTIRNLIQLPLNFLVYRAREPQLEIELTIQETGREVGSSIKRVDNDAVIATNTIPVSDVVKRDTGLDLDEAQVSVLVCPAGEANGGDHAQTGLYWSHLPTEQRSGFGIHIHADFYLSSSRRNLSLCDLTSNEVDVASDPPGWN